LANATYDVADTTMGSPSSTAGKSITPSIVSVGRDTKTVNWLTDVKLV
jgi:hypothetical protein